MGYRKIGEPAVIIFIARAYHEAALLQAGYASDQARCSKIPAARIVAGELDKRGRESVKINLKMEIINGRFFLTPS